MSDSYDQLDDSVVLLPISAPSEPDVTAFIFHTSGSTSGSPKLVPCSYRWLDFCILKAEQVGKPVGVSQHDVANWMGSMCHIAQTFMLLSSILFASCMIQPTKIAFSSDELVDMIHRCGLNRINQFPTFLAIHLRNARSNPKLLALLRGVDQIVYSGLALPREDEEWTSQNSLKIRNLFGSTEIGAMLFQNSEDRLLRPLEGTAYDFVPIEPSSPTSPTESGHTSANHQLLEMVILSHSGDCPNHSLRSADGHFHTGDLFQEVAPGAYVSRGRNDDWIKSENSLRCDTKAIEDNVRATCGDIISDCIVVGNRRPSPVLFVEPLYDIIEDEKLQRLKKDIIRRTRHFHARRYEHERLAGTKFVVVVEKGVLPRTATKGNIRRRAVEEKYETLLDNIFMA